MICHIWRWRSTGCVRIDLACAHFLQLNLEHAVSTIKHHYEKLLFPYERFLVKENKVSTPQGSPQGTPQGTPLKSVGSFPSQTPHSSGRSPGEDEDAAQSSSNSPTQPNDSGQHPLRRSRRYQEAGPEVLEQCVSTVWC